MPAVRKQLDAGVASSYRSRQSLVEKIALNRGNRFGRWRGSDRTMG
ncbi:hypothetical protein S7335_1275 [Synechococcus sp. PCC 7335]|nr:hypothetical protein [Synechococcus sp. PCC 7335]EDX82538.1 hypothetical protein S7335_1242 [Synechococcus sp. PCC 7335]EDX82571.1 hypothetical protein S7335_1275 [Synechococcus sp. PCC 7335]